jgi:hypothetical protein
LSWNQYLKKGKAMDEERIFDEIKLSEQYGDLCGLYKRADDVNPDYDYTYMISINAEIMEPDLKTITDVLEDLCEKHDVDGSIEGLFFEPGYGVVYDNLEINFDHEDDQAAMEFAEDFFRAIQE